MATHVLQVQTQDMPVGELSFESEQDRYRFTYTPAWQRRNDAFPLSPHIPLPGDEPKPGAVQRFLQNLLPEGRALDVASLANQISKDNIFGLVALLGKEPTGALSFTLAQAEAGQATQPIRRVIPDEELSQRIRERDQLPFPVWDGKVRLSVAGYQDKLQVLVEGEQISLADGSLASTHILKPNARNPITPHMVANEHFCMDLARQMGLGVAPVAIRRIPEPILLIERFDRQVRLDPADGKTVATVLRRHVIDGCQALDLPVSFKYERNFGHGRDVRHIREGASFEKFFALAPHFGNPLAARVFLLRWAVLQLLLGNSDAHGKNISFFMRGSHLEPAPLYDLVSVNIYGDQVEQEMAMAYGDAFRQEELTPLELAGFALRTGTPPSVLVREMTTLAQQAKTLAPRLAQSEVYVGEERGLVQSIAQLIVARADWLIQLAPEIPKVDPGLL